jgi:enolase
MPVIDVIKARQIFDSRGTPTVQVEIHLADGGMGEFKTPSGASTGKKEALELRDGGARFGGKGVSQAVMHIQGEITRAVKGVNFSAQSELDRLLVELDGTPDKSRLGANAILPVSAAFAKALADHHGTPLYQSLASEKPCILPVPLINVLNGGAHADNGLEVQEFMLVPWGAPTFSESMRWGAECFYALKSVLKQKGLSLAVGDEGGFAPRLRDNSEALTLLSEAIVKAGFKLGAEVALGLDVAASEFFDEGSRTYRLGGQAMSSSELLDWYSNMARSFALCTIEDPFHEDDHDGFKAITAQLGATLQIVGDDLFVTQKKYIEEGILNQEATAVLIKMNQVGTISETLQAITTAKTGGLNVVISHRSGETEDSTLADLAVAVNAGQIKTGSMSRSERLAKYNRLLVIEEELGKEARFLGHKAFLNRR